MYAQPAPDGWSGCAPSAPRSTVCGQVCGARLASCAERSSAVCPDIATQRVALAARCEATCLDYAPLAELACGALTCDGLLAAISDLVPEADALCARATRDGPVVAACRALDACTAACAADRRARDASACQSACIDALGEAAEVAIQPLTAYRQCIQSCRAEGSDLATCRDTTCRCLHDRCFGEGVPCERARDLCLADDGNGADRGCCAPDEPAGLWRGCDAMDDAPDGGTSSRSCGELALCRAACAADRECARLCVDQSSAEAFDLEQAWRACVDAHADDPSHAIDACRTPRIACRYHALGPDDFGRGGCDGLADCLGACRAGRGGPYCERDCQRGATRDANGLFDGLQDCLDRHACALDAACDACAGPLRACRDG